MEQVVAEPRDSVAARPRGVAAENIDAPPPGPGVPPVPSPCS
jgi:hypothetical protein